ncbi:potassium/sodium hyperpolarization-activated cyclic nucleotide-gated channel 2 isoform X1 [Leptinotarsa decemlineata]|uniref:potassium/sodium hyperpolarization-activated cyclic nucleotide-gated channel 2 isoform X1 n=1 Tax=Leptinotarsa decemlineata TaxID=7539 RepID=UPI000C254635|nr:potassium/sodium hyperpolarization-activated cyclic nucleotide-gated channel 2-like isoform X1 [Leptinotarsa decemlineata]
MLREHLCRLHASPVEILNIFIETGIFIDIRRKFHKFIMISDSHPKTSIYYKSIHEKRNEKVRHLSNYIHIIHPFSMCSLYWEFLVCILYTISFWILAMGAAYEATNLGDTIGFLKISTDLLLTVDVMMIFFTGYYNPSQSKSELKPSSIAKKYLKTYFLLDVLSVSNSYAVLVLRIFPEIGDFVTARVILRIFFALRILRMGRWRDAVDLFSLYANLSTFLSRVLRTWFMFTMMVMWLYAMMFQIDIALDKVFLKNAEWLEAPQFQSFYSATMILLHVSHGDHSIEYIHRKLGIVFFIGIGYCVQLCLFIQILQVWIKFSNARNKNESLFQQFTEYLKYKDLPVSLRKKFFSFYQFKFQNQFYNEAHINRMVSKILKQEILVYVTKNHVQRVEFFKDMPDAVLAKLVSRLKSEIYLANDVILTAGVAGNCMYFIYFGTVAIYSPGGREICHLEDGAHFGEIALIFNEPRVASVKAVTPCELFILNRSDFLEVLEPHPDIKDKITLLAQERLRTTGFLQEDNG